MKPPNYVLSSSAKFSKDKDKTYRYLLERRWNREEYNDLVFIMLNPSTATELEDDRSVRKCTEIARREGYDGVKILNLFALRSTDPGFMLRHCAPMGEDNDWVTALIVNGRDVVCAWGNHGFHKDRAMEVLLLIAKKAKTLYYIEMNKTGMPKHPLYMKNNVTLKEWNDWNIYGSYR